MKKIFSGVLLALLVPAPARAGNGSIWQVETFREFSAGKLDDLSATDADEIRLAPELSMSAKSDELIIWSVAEARDGGIVAGTGNQGKVIHVDRRGTIKELYDSPETGITALAVDRTGNVFAGSMPSGIVYKIPAAGAAQPFYETKDSYVWALCFDPAGNLYAATGNKGRIHRIAPAGAGKVFFESNEPNITSLCWANGMLYAGTSADGLVYRFPEGRPFLVYDADEPEIRGLCAAQNGDVFFAANPSAEGSSEEASGPQVYRLRPDGITENIWAAPDSVILSMDGDPQGGVIIGTGNKGRIYRLDRTGTAALLNQCPETQIISLCRYDRTFFIGTGNPGSVYRLGPDLARSGTIDSRVFDAGTIARWGKTDLDGTTPSGTDIILETRTGNRKEPDPSWSGWSRSAGETVKNPSARFIQWRATLRSQKQGVTPVLKKVSIAYLPANLRPEVPSVTVGRNSTGSAGTSDYGEKKLARTERKIGWTGWDPNGDSLVYAVYFKGTGERSWKLIQENINDKSYILDTQTLPDGLYQVKVAVSDRFDNPGDLALEGEKISLPFLVCNTPPRVEDMKTRPAGRNSWRVTITAASTLALIRSASYSVNAGEWKPIAPADGIFDSKTESFSFDVKLASGEGTVVVKVADEFDNLATAKSVIEAR